MREKVALIALLQVFNVVAGDLMMSQCDKSMSGSIYNNTATTLDMKEAHLTEFKGKISVVLNTACYWGGTPTNLPGMNALLSKYESAGIVGLGFPCNQFGLQEPGKPTEILKEYKYVRPGGGWTQHPMFKIYNTIEVNGKTAHSVYKHLKAACPAYTEDIGDKTGFFWTDVTARDIVWNYEKFLVDMDGKPRYRFAPSVTFPEIYQYVDELIAEKEAKEATPAPASRQRLILTLD